MSEQIFTAKTVEEAKAAAARAFGVKPEEIEFEVLEEPKRGFLGFKKGEAKVRAVLPEKSAPAPAEEPSVSTTISFEEEHTETAVVIADFTEQSERTSANEAFLEESGSEAVPEDTFVQFSESVQETNVQSSDPDITFVQSPESAQNEPEETNVQSPESVQKTNVQFSEPDNTFVQSPESIQETNVQFSEPDITFVQSPESIQETNVQSSEPDITFVQSPESIQETNVQSSESENSGIPEDGELISGEPSPESLQKIERAKAYLKDVLSAMGVQAEFEVSAGSTGAIINISASSSGAVIGKRGETLDALQYLTFMVANRGDRDYYRIILNSADYRERRRKTLQELAGKIARNVLKSGRSTTLEPMNPYERRIIHSAIAEIEGVSSRSTGEEPYRKVVISSVNKPPRPNKRRNQYHHNNKHDSRRRNQDTPPTRISMDSMKTSFEKDYKRSRPEDDINAGLYGKIDI